MVLIKEFRIVMPMSVDEYRFERGSHNPKNLRTDAFQFRLAPSTWRVNDRCPRRIGQIYMTANTQLMEAQQADGAGVELVSETAFCTNLISLNSMSLACAKDVWTSRQSMMPPLHPRIFSALHPLFFLPLCFFMHINIHHICPLSLIAGYLLTVLHLRISCCYRRDTTRVLIPSWGPASPRRSASTLISASLPGFG